jgi:TonB family protein
MRRNFVSRSLPVIAVLSLVAVLFRIDLRAASPQRVQVTGPVVEGFLLTKTEPVYPPIAHQARVQGTVVLSAVISTEGSIETLTLKSGHPMLVQAAIDAVKQWKYKPYLLNNEPVEVDTEIRVNFTLSPSDTPASANAAPDALQAEATNIKTDSILVPEVVGVVRAMLGQQKIDEALDTVNRALAAQPNSAPLLAAKGDVQFRRGEMADAEISYLAARKADPKEVRAYLGLARLYRSYSMYRRAYDLVQVAHKIAPDDVETQALWLMTLPRKDGLAATESFLGTTHTGHEDETRLMTKYSEFLKATVARPIHPCRLVGKVERSEVALEPISPKERHKEHHMSGIGLAAKVNDQNVLLQLDTGASGIMVSRKVADKAGLTFISEAHFRGFGDEGSQGGYVALAKHLQIGELEFGDCLVSVSNLSMMPYEDGLIGANVFASYLIDINLPGMRLKLSPLPKRPEDAVAPTALNSGGEEQPSEDGTTEHTSTEPNSSVPIPASPQPLPKDRYVAPEMANWTQVFRFGHLILVPTKVNESKSMLFLLDTGSYSNLLSVRAGRQVTHVHSNYDVKVEGLSGRVNKVYSSDKATLTFGHLQQTGKDIFTVDLSSIGRPFGTDVSGILGFETLWLLDVELDYRDGLVHFEYDPKHGKR